ncbi:MAG TPA: hypothetical protein VMH83_15075 [Candidatus Acidoferrum sp.]|nr:hypothetical protein [Candidatus Acidoferrum sp.]
MKSPFSIDTPVCTIEEFARRSGMSKRTVRDKVNAGELPRLHTALKPQNREKILINMVKLHQMADAAEFDHPAVNGG